MKEFFQTMQMAMSKSNASRYWKFEFNGMDQSVTIQYFSQGTRTRTAEKNVFYLDPKGCEAAVRYIKNHLS